MPGEDESSASHDSSAFNKVASGLPHVEMVKPAVTAEEETKKNEENTRKGMVEFLKCIYFSNVDSTYHPKYFKFSFWAKNGNWVKSKYFF